MSDDEHAIPRGSFIPGLDKIEPGIRKTFLDGALREVQAATELGVNPPQLREALQEVDENDKLDAIVGDTEPFIKAVNVADAVPRRSSTSPKAGTFLK